MSRRKPLMGTKQQPSPWVGTPAPVFERDAGIVSETLRVDAPWGEALEAAWLIGPSVHGPSAGSENPTLLGLVGVTRPAV